MNNYFLNGDPTLNPGSSFDAKISELQQMQQNLELQKRMYEQQASQPTNEQRSQSPVWDEVDSIWDSMPDKEKELIASNEEFMESNNHISMLLNEQYLAMMRPVVEQSKVGKDALDYHLTLLKRLRKSAQKEVDAEMDDFKEYKEKYSDMPYSEYQKMKREQAKKGGKK